MHLVTVKLCDDPKNENVIHCSYYAFELHLNNDFKIHVQMRVRGHNK